MRAAARLLAVTLRELLDRIEAADQGTIYAEGGAGASPESPALVAREGDEPEPASRADRPGYLLEVSIAREVIQVWSEWRGGAEPTSDERCEAILYYARNDAYLPA